MKTFKTVLVVGVVAVMLASCGKSKIEEKVDAVMEDVKVSEVVDNIKEVVDNAIEKGGDLIPAVEELNELGELPDIMEDGAGKLVGNLDFSRYSAEETKKIDEFVKSQEFGEKLITIYESNPTISDEEASKELHEIITNFLKGNVEVENIEEDVAQ